MARFALPVVFDFLYFQRPLFLALGLLLNALRDAPVFSTSTVANSTVGFVVFMTDVEF